MSRRLAILGSLALVLGLLLALLTIGANKLFLESFAELERQEMARNLVRVRELLASEIAQLGTIAGDYAGWDEAYRFVQDGNDQFVKTNLDDAIFPQLRLDVFLFLDGSGRILFSKAFKPATGAEVPLSRSLHPYLRPDSILMRHDLPGRKAGGVVSLADGLLLIASHPVLKSDYTGPALGTLVIGRYLDTEEVRRLSNIGHLSITVARTTPRRLADDFVPALAALKAGSAAYFATPSAEKIYGYTLFQDVDGKPAFVLRVDSPRSIYRKGLDTIHWFVFFSVAVAIVTGAALFVLIDRLVFARRQGQEVQIRYQSIIERAAEGIAILEPASFSIIEVNDAFVRFVGISAAELAGRSLTSLIPMEEAEAGREMARILAGKREVQFRRRDGSLLIAEVTVTRIPYQDGEAMALIAHDATERRCLEDRLAFQAHHDPLTKLPNRILLNDRLQQALADAARQKRRLAVALIDLDNFKLVNDNLGHEAGDQLLIVVARRFRAACRSCDTLARLGGDEFVHFFGGLHRVEDAIKVACLLRDTLTEPFRIGDQEIFVTASIGIAQYPEDGDSGEELIRKADTAMYHVKSRGKSGFAFFNEEMNRTLRERTAIEAHLRRAIEREELHLLYQPKVSLVDGRITGVETLLRWTSSELGEVPPDKFLPVAEETGLIVPISDWVLRHATGQVRRWLAGGLPALQVAVNISAREFTQGALVERVRSILAQTGLHPTLLELELTESLMMKNVPESIRRMRELKELGIGLAVDDFGTGYSSLSCISQFPIDRMKIDKSFIHGLHDDPAKNAIVRMIIVMAHTLGIVVTAEGVETAKELEFIRNNGCEEMQGFYFSPAIPADALEKLVREGLSGDGRCLLAPAGWASRSEARSGQIPRAASG